MTCQQNNIREANYYYLNEQTYFKKNKRLFFKWNILYNNVSHVVILPFPKCI